MGAKTNIEWTDSTFNPWVGCTKISPACDHCYAEAMMDTRMGRARWGAGQPRVRTSVANWRKPVQWNKNPFRECGKCGWRGERSAAMVGCASCGSSMYLNEARRRVFCASLADVFDNEVDPQWRADVLALIRATPNLDWLLLTKRIGNAERMLQAAATVMDTGMGVYAPSIYPNLWLGATICNQEEADRDIPKLLATPAAVRFLSIEPMLSEINFRWTPYAHQASGETYREYLEREGKVSHLEALSKIDWVIVGGESGAHARPINPAWVRSVRDQCKAAGVPFLFKQWGEWAPPDDIDANGKAWQGRWEIDRDDGGVPRKEWNDNATPCLRSESFRVGKKAAGRLLDGITHSEYPQVRSRQRVMSVPDLSDVLNAGDVFPLP